VQYYFKKFQQSLLQFSHDHSEIILIMLIWGTILINITISPKNKQQKQLPTLISRKIINRVSVIIDKN